MKILHYIKAFSQLYETFIYDQIIELEKTNINNFILTNKRKLEKERPFDKISVIPETDRNIFKKIFYKYHPKKYHKMNKNKFIETIEIIKPDIMHSHFGYAAVSIFDFFKKTKYKNIPFVITFHGSDIHTLPFNDIIYKKKLLEIDSYKNSYYITHSNFIKNQAINLGLNKNKFFIVENFYNDKFNSFNKNDPDGIFKIINIGKLRKIKSQDNIIKAFKKFNDEIHNNSHLTIIGEGKEKNRLKKLAKKFNLKNKIEFTGGLVHNKIPTILNNSDVYIHSSLKEGMPISILEAMSTGMPVIATNVGATKEIFTKWKRDNNFLIEPNNCLAIFNSLREVFLKKNRIDNTKCQLFTIKNNINSITKIYKKLMQKSNE